MTNVRMLLWWMGVIPDPRPAAWIAASQPGDRLADTIAPYLFALTPHWEGVRGE